MGLHKRFPVAHGEHDDVYASLELQQPAEKYIFPEKKATAPIFFKWSVMN